LAEENILPTKASRKHRMDGRTKAEKIIDKFNLKSTQRNPGRPKKGS